ncbi:hypothetical protein ACFRLW_27970 [Streptomyces sp. NPDC056728]
MTAAEAGAAACSKVARAPRRTPAPNLQRCDENNRGTFWQVLQFGVQNLYDPELDEWLVMDTFEHPPSDAHRPTEHGPDPSKAPRRSTAGGLIGSRATTIQQQVRTGPPEAGCS